MKKILWSITLILFTVGCFGGGEDNGDDKGTTSSNYDDLKAEYEEIVVSLNTALEKGYSYSMSGLITDAEGKMLSVSYDNPHKRSGPYIQIGNATSSLFRIGKVDDKHFRVILTDGEHFKVEETEITDSVQENAELLKEQLLAHSVGESYNHLDKDWEVKNVEIEKQNGRIIIKVESKSRAVVAITEHIDRYTINDGLIENYTLENHDGEKSYSYYYSTGPIDEESMIELYDRIKEKFNERE